MVYPQLVIAEALEPSGSMGGVLSHPKGSTAQKWPEGARAAAVMKVRQVTELDLREVKRWYKLHEDIFPEGMLPPIGLIVPGVAAGWLVKTDAGFGMLEGFITNPEAPANMRNLALDEITLGLIDRAKNAGLPRVVALFSNDAIASRAKKHGLKDIGLYRMASRNT